MHFPTSARRVNAALAFANVLYYTRKYVLPSPTLSERSLVTAGQNNRRIDMRFILDRARCDGNGNCARAAPQLIVLDESDSPVMLHERVGEDHRAVAEAAVRACPKRALQLAGLATTKLSDKAS